LLLVEVLALVIEVLAAEAVRVDYLQVMRALHLALLTL
jgi:hypothetical protein